MATDAGQAAGLATAKVDAVTASTDARYGLAADFLLRDQIEADLLADGITGVPSSRNVELWLEFIRAPSPAGWYRAHNASVAAGYLAHEAWALVEYGGTL